MLKRSLFSALFAITVLCYSPISGAINIEDWFPKSALDTSDDGLDLNFEYPKQPKDIQAVIDENNELVRRSEINRYNHDMQESELWHDKAIGLVH